MKNINISFLLPLIATFFEFVEPAAVWHTANDGRKYLIEGSASYNWLQASDQCARRDLQLAVIDSSAKNNALVALLKKEFGKSRDLWLGHHDEFNTKKDKNRAWYSATTGQRISFGYWDSGEPNNKNGEHCTQIYRKANFKWNDEDCDTHYFGYICEEHYLTAKYRTNMEQKRLATNRKNDQLSKDFSRTQSEIQKINTNTRGNTDKLLVSSQNSLDEALEEFKKSFMELITQKPYMQAVIADLGDAINGLALGTHEKLLEISQQTRKSVEDVHTNAEKSTNSVTAEFAQKLTSNKNEINALLVY